MFVFAYGSLSAEALGAGPAPLTASLTGYVRTWDVAMDNLAEIPGYKYYVDPATGERPAVHVTFLDLTPRPGADCVGLLLPVTPTTLARLDHRERNYDRVEITDQIRSDGALKTRVYTYLGMPEARARYRTAAACKLAVISRAYLDAVERGFAEAGLADAYAASTLAPEAPVRDLVRVNLPARSGAPARA